MFSFVQEEILPALCLRYSEKKSIPKIFPIYTSGNDVVFPSKKDSNV